MVYVFKTSVSSQMKAKAINTYLSEIKEIDHWNFDLEDCDNILRIVADNLDVQRIVKSIKSLGFVCEELE